MAMVDIVVVDNSGKKRNFNAFYDACIFVRDECEANRPPASVELKIDRVRVENIRVSDFV